MRTSKPSYAAWIATWKIPSDKTPPNTFGVTAVGETSKYVDWNMRVSLILFSAWFYQSGTVHWRKPRKRFPGTPKNRRSARSCSSSSKTVPDEHTYLYGNPPFPRRFSRVLEASTWSFLVLGFRDEGLWHVNWHGFASFHRRSTEYPSQAI